MATFIKNQIVKQAKISIEAGIEKYKAYFINTSHYQKYRAQVDAKLTEEGFAECIVKDEVTAE